MTPTRRGRFPEGHSPRSPGPFPLQSHRRGKFQSVLSVGTQTAPSRTGGSSEGLQRHEARGSHRSVRGLESHSAGGKGKDRQAAMETRSRGFSF